MLKVGQFINMVDDKFGQLTVKKIVYERNPDGRIQWECECTCGNIKISTRHALRNGLQSCGCLRTKLNSQKANKLNRTGRNRHPKAKELLSELYARIKSKQCLDKILPEVEKFLNKKKHVRTQ